MGRWAGLAACVLLAVACQQQGTPAPSPASSTTPHTPALSAVLQPSDVPSGLTECTISGPMTTYLSTIAAANPTLGSAVQSEWSGLRAAGATEGAISIFTADPSACTAELGATKSVKAAASFVGFFSDPGEADRAWGTGLFGFVPPAPGEVAPGVTRGPATGLGISSFTYINPPIQLASWRHGMFVALVVLTNLDPATFKSATTAVDARLN